MTAVGISAVRTLRDLGQRMPLSDFVNTFNAYPSNRKLMKSNGALTPLGRDIYQKELNQLGVKSVKELINVLKEITIQQELDAIGASIKEQFDKAFEKKFGNIVEFLIDFTYGLN